MLSFVIYFDCVTAKRIVRRRRTFGTKRKVKLRRPVRARRRRTLRVRKLLWFVAVTVTGQKFVCFSSV